MTQHAFGMYVLVFLAMTATDFIWAEYIKATADKRPWKSATLSVLIIVVGAIVTRAYVDDATNLVPAAFGAFTGTFISVWRERKIAG